MARFLDVDLLMTNYIMKIINNKPGYTVAKGIRIFKKYRGAFMEKYDKLAKARQLEQETIEMLKGRGFQLSQYMKEFQLAIKPYFEEVNSNINKLKAAVPKIPINEISNEQFLKFAKTLTLLQNEMDSFNYVSQKVMNMFTSLLKEPIAKNSTIVFKNIKEALISWITSYNEADYRLDELLVYYHSYVKNKEK